MGSLHYMGSVVLSVMLEHHGGTVVVSLCCKQTQLLYTAIAVSPFTFPRYHYKQQHQYLKVSSANIVL